MPVLQSISAYISDIYSQKQYFCHSRTCNAKTPKHSCFVDFVPKNVLFPTLEPAMPKLPNTLSKGYLDNVDILETL